MPKRDHVNIVKSHNGLTKLIITNDAAEAEIYLHGAHLTHYKKMGDTPLIFDAKESSITPPKSVHAGVPICWPWFGSHRIDPTLPQHGFARDMLWELKSSHAPNSATTIVTLMLTSSSVTQKFFPYDFTLEIAFEISQELTISLTTTNLAKTSFSITQALHTYFAVSDITEITIHGVEKIPFIDYTDDKREKVEKSALTINQEINRVYIPTQHTCFIEDKGLKRRIVIEKNGSDSTTIWNPWKDNQYHDLPDDKYRKFVCIETTNALEDTRTLVPNASHTIRQCISLRQW